jgi:2-amino-4-hydroxy-6-hydroxymethyldihydropteridine diphosphokinase
MVYALRMRMHPPITAYIALGANLGDREANIGSALQRLSKIPGITISKTSSLFENPSVGGGENAPAYLNAAAELQTVLGSHALLRGMLEIEREMGRRRRVKWEPRPIDLDLLLYGDQILSSDDLVVPHPLMHERRFVLQPLAEIAPQAVHPVLQMTIAGLLQDLTDHVRFHPVDRK